MSLNISGFKWYRKSVSNRCVKNWTGGCFLISSPPIQGKVFRVKAKTIRDLLRALTGLTGPKQHNLGSHPNPFWGSFQLSLRPSVPADLDFWLNVDAVSGTTLLPGWVSGMGPALPDSMRGPWCPLALTELLTCAGRRDTSFCLKYKWMQNKEGWIF